MLSHGDSSFIITAAQKMNVINCDVTSRDIITKKKDVRGFFDTDLHEVSWHFATHEAVRPSGF